MATIAVRSLGFAALLSVAALCACTNSSDKSGSHDGAPQSATSAVDQGKNTAGTAQSNGASSSEGTNGLTFHGFPCRGSCIGHERGYEWAEEHSIDNPRTCYSGPRLSDPSNESFSEGCEAYVDDSTGAARLDVSERYDDASSGSDDDSDSNQ
jgi:hypothetical protein